MFSNVGWGEILLLFVVGLVIIGPERLPRLIEDLRATILAARTAITNAKQQLDNDFGEEFDEIRKPISQIAQIQRMSPRTAISKALFDGDNEFLDSFDPKKIMAGDTAGEAHRDSPKNKLDDATVVERPTTQSAPGKQDAPRKDGPDYSGGAKAAWTDIL
ncbi:Sec-independent protein translocase subunit TatB [Corynebacterium pacaense]|uniref:Sec-independent protein translocase subunit TatB n=1 Tax=Corynebacterium pacaense TaxID=1816684 RepID=UPI0009BBFE8C|nr:Sec-independent protein translocase subunit TatB [Corynebacterium pacaense]